MKRASRSRKLSTMTAPRSSRLTKKIGCSSLFRTVWVTWRSFRDVVARKEHLLSRAVQRETNAKRHACLFRLPRAIKYIVPCFHMTWKMCRMRGNRFRFVQIYFIFACKRLITGYYASQNDLSHHDDFVVVSPNAGSDRSHRMSHSYRVHIMKAWSLSLTVLSRTTRNEAPPVPIYKHFKTL